MNTMAKIKQSGVLALEQLTVPAADNPRNTFKIADLVNDVVVKVPKSADMRNTDSIQLWLDGVAYGDSVDLEPVDLEDPDLIDFDLLIKVANFPAHGTDTIVSIDYQVFDTASEDGQLSNLPVRVRFDQRAPGGDRLPSIFFTDEQLAGGITVADLVEDPDDNTKKLLPLIIDPYFDGEDADVIELWLGTSSTTGKYLTPTFTVTDPRLQFNVSIAEQDLLAGNDGDYFFGYRATDWAGNVSAISELTRVPVYLRLPVLDAPLVPQNDDGLITYNDANTPPDSGVEVRIPTYAGAAVGDRLYVTWGTQTLAPYTLVAGDLGNDPIAKIIVPYATVAAIGNGDVDVQYQMQRTGVPSTDSPVKPVKVDLRTPGGPDPDPDPETPEHENIKPLDISCGTSPVNTIQPADYGKPATATIHRVGFDLNVIWAIGDEIQVFWGSVSTPQIAPVRITPVNEGTDITINVPFASVIEAEGVGLIDVYFTLTRTLLAGTPPVTVTVSAPVQPVNVVSSNALPGDGSPLAAGTFPEANANNIITRAAGIDGTTFEISLDGVSNIELIKNPTISYNFVGVSSGDATTNPGAPPIEASRLKVEDLPITQAMLDAKKLVVPLPYSLTYFICRNGAILDYSIANNLGRTNGTQKFVRFAMNQGGGTCTLP